MAQKVFAVLKEADESADGGLTSSALRSILLHVGCSATAIDPLLPLCTNESGRVDIATFVKILFGDEGAGQSQAQEKDEGADPSEEKEREDTLEGEFEEGPETTATKEAVEESGDNEMEEDDEDSDNESPWKQLGGKELEPALRDGLVKCLDSRYLVERARRGDPFVRRQEMPEDAYLSLDSLKQLGVYLKGMSEGLDEVTYEWLPLVIVSYAWLSPAHPDPFGETLQVLAKALEHMEPHGVIIDFTALPQVPRTDVDEKTFKLGLPSLNRFYSHPHVLVLKVSNFPEGYPGSKAYNLPEGYEPVQYSGRGWCFAEAAMAGLGKSPKLVCDASLLQPGRHAVGGSVVFPRPPLVPEKFNAELQSKKFTQPKADMARVQDLYKSAFGERVTKVKTLQFVNLKWGPADIVLFAEALAQNQAAETLELMMNNVGQEGMNELGKVLGSHRSMRKLNFTSCSLGGGALRELGKALHGNATITKLDLTKNEIGNEGAQFLAKGLKENRALQTLWLNHNAIGDEGACALAEGLKENRALQTLWLNHNAIGDEGACALAEVEAARPGLEIRGV